MLSDFIILDLESAAREDARKWVQPDSRLVDKAKIAASIEERAEKLALDPNGARIVCVGVQTQRMADPVIWTAPTREEEIAAIEGVWRLWREGSHACRFVGFNARRFDMRMLIQRSRFLGLDTPPISLARYGKGDVLDLFEELTFDEWNDGTAIVPRTLSAFCEQFGIAVADGSKGSEIAMLVADNAWATIEHHNRSDVIKTRMLAERLGLIKFAAKPVPLSMASEIRAPF